LDTQRRLPSWGGGGGGGGEGGAYFSIVMKLKFFSDFRIIRRKTAKFFLNSGISEILSKTWLLIISKLGISELVSKIWMLKKAIPIGFLKRVGLAAMGRAGTGRVRMGRVGTGQAKMSWSGTGWSWKKLQRTLFLLTG
jgi:hypothetical protein